MAPSPSSPLQDLGALVLGNDALDLEQEVVLGAGANGPVEEGDLTTPARRNSSISRAWCA
jgi:hypothetical protein